MPWALPTAFLALAYAINKRNGAFHLVSLASLTAAFVLVAWHARREPLPAPRWALGVVFGAGALMLATRPLTIAVGREAWSTLLPVWGLIVATIALHGLRAKGAFWVTIAAWLGVACWIIAGHPAPDIDVFQFQRAAGDALLSGSNPFLLRHPNIYADDAFYGPGIVADGLVQVGFPYPPLTAVLAAVGEAFFGDFRFLNAVMTAAAVAIVGLLPMPRARDAALVFLFAPRNFFLLERGWTEPGTFLCLALFAYTVARAERGRTAALGLSLASKQYAIWLLPLAPLVPGLTRRALLAAVALAGFTLLPFFVWNPSAFWHDVVAFQFAQPFRADALSFAALVQRVTGVAPPAALAFAAAAIAVGVSLWRAPRSLARFFLAASLTYFSFFAFNKQAFANYYTLVLFLLALTLATSRDDSAEQPAGATGRSDTPSAAPHPSAI